MKMSIASLRLRTKAALIVGLILLLVLGLNSFFSSRMLIQELRRGLEAKAVVLGGLLVKDIRKVLDFGLGLKDLEDASKRCETLVLEHPELAFTMVVDPAGIVVFHSNSSLVGRPAGASLPAGATEASEALSGTIRVDGATVFTMALPIRDSGGRSFGAVVLGVREAAISEQVNANIRTAMVTGTLSFATTLALIMIFITTQIGRPVVRLVTVANAVAEGDLTQTIETRSRDEIFDLYSAFNHMLRSLRDLQGRTAAAFQELERSVGAVSSLATSLEAGAGAQSRSLEEISVFINHMNDQARSVSRTMEQLASTSEETSSSIMEMIASIEQVAGNAGALSENVSQTSASVEQVLVSNKEIARNVESFTLLIAKTSAAVTEIDASVKEVQSLAQNSRQLSEQVRENALNEGGGAVEEAMVEMRTIRSSVLTLAGTIEKLGGSVDNIGEILVVIDDVAEQTNLLALNAAIIAAQAGEHGRGFAVVAEEIRELAERTSNSTKEIAKVISGIQEESRNVGLLVKDGVTRVDSGVQAVGRTNAALKQIISSAERATEMSARIAAATGEQASGSREVARAVQEVADRSTEIMRATTEQARGSEAVMHAVEGMRDMAEQVRRATVEQTSGARLIARASENATVLARQVNQGSQEGRQLSERSVSEVATIQAAARETMTIVTRMKQIVDSFGQLSEHLKKTLSQFRT
ncbi:MAG: methyl-accepting chemotaxis protein [Candidatus Methylomirabilia bacterium]